MRRTTVLWEIWVMRFEDAISWYRRRQLSASEAGELLGISERHFRRLCGRYEDEGEAGLCDRRLGKVSPRRAPAGELERARALYRERYGDFTAKHFHEHLQRDHHYKLSYTLTRLTLQKAGLIERAKRRGAHRKKRPRRPLPGMMLFQDGSQHAWIPGLGHQLDLIVTMDDADGRIYSAFLVAEEGTDSSFQGLIEVIEGHGLFGSLYVDRGGHYFHTPKGGGPVDKEAPTQVGRALAQLGVTLIPSYSPEARGRIERMFQTLQGRLPQELKLNGIPTIAAANRYLREVFLPDFNHRFAVAPAEPGTAFIAYVGRPLAEILCRQEERTVGNDNTVRYKRLSLQIPPQRHRHHYVRVRVRVHEYPDGTVAIFDGPRCLARYDAKGCLSDAQTKAA
ncbi:MAG: ISNCY family transposase [Pseudomonadota bacterium]